MSFDSAFLTPISRTTVADEIVNQLSSFILEAGLKPGDRLPPERELMRQLGVGRTSMREAIKTLSAVGALRVAGREGTFVGTGGTSLLTKPLFWNLLLGERTMGEVMEARQILEVELAGLAAQRATEEELAAMTIPLEKMRAALHDPAAYSGHDLDFHLALAAGAHNLVLHRTLDTLRHVIRAWIGKNILDYQGRPKHFGEHVAIFEAVKARDHAEARRLMAEHLETAAEPVLASFNITAGATRG